MHGNLLPISEGKVTILAGYALGRKVPV